MKSSLFTASILAFISSGALAQEITFVDLSYTFSQLEAGGDDITDNRIEGTVEYTTGQFVLSGDLEYRTISTGSDNVSIYGLGAGAAYMVTPQALVGAGVRTAGSDEAGSENLNGWDVFAQYVEPTFGVAISVFDDDADDDDRLTTIYGEYTVTPGLDLGVQLAQFTDQDSTTIFLSADYGADVFDVRGYYQTDSEDDVGILGLRGHYMVTNDVRVGASYQTFVGSDAPDFDAYNVTGGYQLTDGVWIDALYGRFDGFGPDDIDRIQVSISYETGRQIRMDQRMEEQEREDLRTGLGALFFL